MSLQLQTLARSAFATIQTAIPESVVVVVSNGQTANGFLDTSMQSSSLNMLGEMGQTTSIVRLDASKMDTPAKDATIIVAGKPCFVQSAKLDPVGALLTIAFSEQRPTIFPEVANG